MFNNPCNDTKRIKLNLITFNNSQFFVFQQNYSLKISAPICTNCRLADIDIYLSRIINVVGSKLIFVKNMYEISLIHEMMMLKCKNDD